MTHDRILNHPILSVPERKTVSFRWNGKAMKGYDREMISSALFANGVRIFGHHYRDQSPQGMFCANGQCSQCLVIADSLPVKACMTPLREGMVLESVEGLPRLPEDDRPVTATEIPVEPREVLIIGGGPAGLSAAIELGGMNIDTLIVDDKDRLGGKLVLQTHKFFGSVEDSYAGTRGYEIGTILEEKIRAIDSIEVWLETMAVGVFSDGVVGVVQNGRYRKIKPQKLLVATGAREKMIAFPGNTLPGVYGAGAFQTLVNRDLVKSSRRVLIVGGGNVGLIAGYHAIQAGIEVVALIEALPQVGGYKVHADKLLRLGVPIFTRHTIVSANGEEAVESATIAQLDEQWQIIPATRKTIKVDTVLIAVGLAEVNEFYLKAKEWGMDAYTAGDAGEIAEASAAMFSGKIEGLKIARALGRYKEKIPVEWDEKAKILKSKPGNPVQRPLPDVEEGVVPLVHCYQEVPCNPCTSVCSENIIKTENDSMTGLPEVTDTEKCQGCMACVAVCPGLAISLLDFRKDAEYPKVTLPYEIGREKVAAGQDVIVTDVNGETLGTYPVKRVISNRKKFPGTLLVQVQMEKKLARHAIGIRLADRSLPTMDDDSPLPLSDEAIICRCERVTAGEIRAAVRAGIRDMNQLKAISRAGMGSCGSKTCRPLIWRIFQEEGVDIREITDRVDRPLFVEVPFGILAGIDQGE
jgi:NADPH-dependent 2,4-dienoyl-CoA reductase/sulfur reductase-like enzyme/Fe-S-cluster-containing hydrogenase component 2/bacterioferritin-associated ferredoxin